MHELFSVDIENRGMILDPRTKLIVMLMIVFFALGGMGSDIRAVRIVVSVLTFLPIALLFTAKRWERALIYGSVYIASLALNQLVIPEFSGFWKGFLAILIMIVLRYIPGLMMGAYILSSTTVSEFVASMHRMHVTEKITIPMSVMFRFFPTVTEEFASISSAMKMREISLFGKNRGKWIEYRMIPLLVCSANIGNELSAAALTRGLSARRKRTNICRIGFHVQDVCLILVSAVPFAVFILGKAGVLS